MTDNAQQGNNMSSSAQGAPKPTGDKPQGTEAGRVSQGAPRTDQREAGRAAIGAPRAKKEDEENDDPTLGNTAVAAFYGDHPQRSAAARERARGDAEQRGAGSGENANATRGRSLIDWPPTPLTHAEHVEELLEMAQENEDYNARVNEEQVAVVRNESQLIGRALYPIGDPKLEEQSRADAVEDYRHSHDRNWKMERLRGEMEARASRDRKQEEEMYGMKGEEDARDVADPKGRIRERDQSEHEAEKDKQHKTAAAK
jgi:hypothetical protein